MAGTTREGCRYLPAPVAPLIDQDGHLAITLNFLGFALESPARGQGSERAWDGRPRREKSTRMPCSCEILHSRNATFLLRCPSSMVIDDVPIVASDRAERSAALRSPPARARVLVAKGRTAHRRISWPDPWRTHRPAPSPRAVVRNGRRHSDPSRRVTACLQERPYLSTKRR